MDTIRHLFVAPHYSSGTVGSNQTKLVKNENSVRATGRFRDGRPTYWVPAKLPDEAPDPLSSTHAGIFESLRNLRDFF